MPWFSAVIYDRWMQSVETACLIEWRAALVRDVSGRVLEVGAGTGAMLEHYPGTVEQLVLAEPDRHMRRRLEARCRVAACNRAEVSDNSLERLALPDESFDAVVSTLVLCSVPSVQTALAEIFRVLKPGGRFFFLEHVADDRHSPRFAWQRRIEPAWKFLAGNCHLTRETEHAIDAAGFQLEQITRESLRKTLPFMRPSIRGMARRPVS